MQSFKVQVREEQRTQECLKQLAQCYRELNRLPKVSELDEMAREGHGRYGYYTMRSCLGPKGYWLDRLRKEGYIEGKVENVREERQEVRFVGQRKIDGQVRSRMAKRKKTAKEVETLSQQYRSTSRKAELEAMIKSRWGKPRTAAEERAFKEIDAQVALTPEERLWLRIKYLEGKRDE